MIPIQATVRYYAGRWFLFALFTNRKDDWIEPRNLEEMVIKGKTRMEELQEVMTQLADFREVAPPSLVCRRCDHRKVDLRSGRE